MKDDRESQRNSPWQKTQYANLVRYKASGVYFARMRVQGKLIQKSSIAQNTSSVDVNLTDLSKGVYFISITDADHAYRSKFVAE